MRGCILIISCYASKRVPQLTWIRNIPPTVDYVIVRGNPDLSVPFDYNPSTHECVLRCSDMYDGLPQKIRAGLQFVYTQFNPSFVFKIDDDVLLDMTQLLKITETKDEYVGRVTYNYCPSVNLSILYCGGPIYYLSANALKLLQTMDDTVFCSEDANIGWHLTAVHSIPIHNVHLYTDDIRDAETFIAYHDKNRVLFKSPTPTPTPKPYKFSFMRR